MTRDQITTLVTGTVGQTDATSVALCNDYVQRAYEMVWNAELWRDAVTIDATATIGVGANTFNLPSGFERIISIEILFSGVVVGFLDPTTTTFIFQTEATSSLSTNPGVPKKYEEFVHTDGTKKVRVFPYPDNTYTFIISGKRTCPILGASDSLQIRNVDNAVIALATADMYTRLRQLGKAGEMAKKAGAFLEEAKAIEKEQSNKPRSAKALTVTTNSFAELIDAVCARAGTYTPDVMLEARHFIKRRYRMIWNKYLWRDTITHATASTVNAQNYIAVPAGIERVISVTVNGILLDPVDLPSLLQIEPTILSQSGQPKYFQEIDSSGTKQIRLLPVPDAVYSMVVAGKKTITNLSTDTDLLGIRNIDNALIALAAYDLQQRLGQTDAAKMALEEGQSELQAAIDLEANQAFKERRAKALTATSNSLGELADSVCARCGVYTPENVILAKDFVKRRYRMIWDICLWRESTTTASVSSVSAQNYIPMPSGLERAISVTVADKLLDPVDDSYLMQVDPTIFTRSGVPVAFEERDVAGVKRIMLYPTPDAIYSMIVSGKKTITNLSADADVPVLRNIDNALIAFAASDLHARLGQSDQAKTALEEGGAALQVMKDLDTQQTFRARKSKPLTVAGNSLSELADAVGERTGQYTPDALISIKDFLRRNYQQVYDSNLWTESTVVINATSVNGILVLPWYVDRVISIRGNSNLGQLSAVQPSLYYGINPWIFEQTGDPLAFSYFTAVGVEILPTQVERLSIVSNGANDKTPVFIVGEIAPDGGIVSESITLNGTTPVLTANAYWVPLTIAKNITSGTVTVSGNTSATQFLQLLGNERERKHIRLWFQPTPTTNVTCKVLCKRKVKPLVQDEDTPLLRDIGNVLINLSAADMFSKMGKKDNAAEALAKANSNLKTLIELETQQGANGFQVVPEAEYYGTDFIDSDAWVVAK